MDQVREVARSYTIELPILSNTNSKINFSDNETVLDDKIITAIALLPNLTGVAPSGRQQLYYTDAFKGFLTLCDKDRNELNKMLPLELILRSDPIIHFKRRMISIRNSYVEFPNINAFSIPIPAGPPAGFALVFTFFYEDFDPSKHRIGNLGEVELISER